MDGNRSYDDIIDLPAPTSAIHKRMPRIARAAQFAPFAAMVGHDLAIAEVARITEERITPSEERIAELDEILRMLSYHIESHPPVAITYFKADERKSGGAYIRAEGEFLGVDTNEGVIRLSGGVNIPIYDTVEILSPILDE
ncbi:MAG: hypothetical protein J6Q69_07800 [Clostridia bacterium]|nr:hypothetical protein [Clostridia bacterium]